MTQNEQADKLPPTEEGEDEVMPRIQCEECRQVAELRLWRTQRSAEDRAFELRGIVTCTCGRTDQVIIYNGRVVWCQPGFVFHLFCFPKLPVGNDGLVVF